MQSRGNPNSDHRRHDRLLVTRFAGGDSYPTEQADAEALIASCSECAALAADIQLLSVRAHALPRARRPRDFRLTPEQADQLTGSWLQRLMRGLASPGWTVVRPLAGAAFAIGLTLAVIGALPVASPFAREATDSGLGAAPGTLQVEGAPNPTDLEAPAPTTKLVPGPSTATQPEGTTEGFPLSPADPATVASGGQDIEPPTNSDRLSTPLPAEIDGISNAYVAPSTVPQPGPAEPGGSLDLGTGERSDSNRELLTGAGIALALAGLGLLLVAWLARRRYSDPLLR